MLTKESYKKTIECNINYNYACIVSGGADYTKERLPMIIFLHGAGERGNDLDKVTSYGVPYELEHKKCGCKCIAIAPQCPEGMVWNSQIYNLKIFIEDMIEKYNADAERVSITGLSMGGFGTWEMAMTFPNMFSAVAPICGGGMAWRVDSLKNKPIRVFHGAEDKTVLPRNSIEMVEALRWCGGNPELTIYENVGHESWFNAYDTDLIEWLIAQKR